MTQKDYQLYRYRLPTAFDFMLSSRVKLDAIIEKIEKIRTGFDAAYTRWHGGSNKPIADITDAELAQLNRLLKFYGDQLEPLAEKYEVQRRHFETKVRNVNDIYFQLYRHLPVPKHDNPHEQLAAFMQVEKDGGMWVQQ